MKIPCEMAQDLLPLYEEELCSPVSRAAVEEHLKTCPSCRRQMERVRNLEAPPADGEMPEVDRVVAKSFRKVRRRWWTSLAAVLLVVPFVWMCVNQYRGQGICFTNLDDIWAARRYCAALAEGDFEKAAGYMDYDGLYQEIQDILSWELEDYAVAYTPVTVGEERYFATLPFYEEHLQDQPSELDFWCSVVLNGVPGCMVPEGIWGEVTALEPEAVGTGSDGSITVNGHSFWRIGTKWGVYYSMDRQLAVEPEPEALVQRLALVPAAIYEEGKTAIAAQEQSHYDFNQAYYQEAKDMSPEEFEAYVKEWYIADLQRIADSGYSFEIGGYDFGYYVEGDGDWVIEYDMRLIRADRTHRFSIHICVQDGGLDIGAMTVETPEITEFDLGALLFFGYPNE